MIRLSPLVIDHERCDPVRSVPADEYHCVWFRITDKIRYLPWLSRNVSYKACFYDLPSGLQTHVYAPANLDIREKWSVGGNMPNEPRQIVELGLTDAPRNGLYLREDVNMGCKSFVVPFVQKKLKDAHKALVERLIIRADILRRSSEMQTPSNEQFRDNSPISLDDDTCLSPGTIICSSGHYEANRNAESQDPVEIPLPLRRRYELVPELP